MADERVNLIMNNSEINKFCFFILKLISIIFLFFTLFSFFVITMHNGLPSFLRFLVIWGFDVVKIIKFFVFNVWFWVLYIILAILSFVFLMWNKINTSKK